MKEKYEHFNSGHLEEALHFATKMHSGQARWGGEPYITHPVQVSINTEKYFEYYGYVLNIVAILHDVIEDCFDGDFESGKAQIFGKFGVFVADTLMLLTHDKTELTYPEYISRIAESGNVIAMIVKLSDLEHNLSCCYETSKKSKTHIAKYEMSKAFLEYAYTITHKKGWIL